MGGWRSRKYAWTTEEEIEGRFAGYLEPTPEGAQGRGPASRRAGIEFRGAVGLAPAIEGDRRLHAPAGDAGEHLLADERFEGGGLAREADGDLRLAAVHRKNLNDRPEVAEACFPPPVTGHASHGGRMARESLCGEWKRGGCYPRFGDGVIDPIYRRGIPIVTRTLL
jgi:hypothetical protein